MGNVQSRNELGDNAGAFPGRLWTEHVVSSLISWSVLHQTHAQQRTLSWHISGRGRADIEYTGILVTLQYSNSVGRVPSDLFNKLAKGLLDIVSRFCTGFNEVDVVI